MPGTRKLGRPTDQRIAMLRGMVTALLENGKIQAILSPESPLDPSCQVIDAAGQYVVPGGIDGHVHFGGFGDIPIADDFYTGSKAALAGGTTTVVDFCEPAEGENPLAEGRRKGRGGGLCPAFHLYGRVSARASPASPDYGRGHYKLQGVHLLSLYILAAG